MNLKRLFKYLFIVIIFILLLIAIYQRFLLPFVPYDIVDCYYCPTINFFKGTGFHQTYRLPLYPLIFFVTTYITQSFTAITYLQVFLGLATSLFLVYLFEKITFISKKSTTLYRYILGIIIFATFIFSTYKIDFERCIRPEIFSHFFQLLLVFLLFNIFKTFPKINYRLGIFVFVSCFVSYYQDKFLGITILNLILVLLLIFSRKGQKILPLFRYLFLPLTLFFVFYFSLQRLTISKAPLDLWNNHTVWAYNGLFWRNQDSIIKLIKSDYENPNFTKYSKKVLKMHLDFYNTKIKDYYPEHGVQIIQNLDHVYFDLTPNFNLQLGTVQPQSEFYELRKYYLYKSLFAYPIDYIRKYIIQIWTAYLPFNSQMFLYDEPIVPRLIYLKIENNFVEDPVYLDRHIPVVNKYYYQVITAKNTSSLVFKNEFFDEFYIYFNEIYTPILIIFLFFFFRDKKTFWKKPLGFMAFYTALSAFLMYSYTCFTYLTIERYLAEIFPLFLLSLFLMFYYLFHRFIKD